MWVAWFYVFVNRYAGYLGFWNARPFPDQEPQLFRLTYAHREVTGIYKLRLHIENFHTESFGFHTESLDFHTEHYGIHIEHFDFHTE